MTFVVVGGGPTGVEMAGAIAEIARQSLARDFRHIDTRDARVMLVEAGDRLLSTFPERLSRQALQDLRASRSRGEVRRAGDGYCRRAGHGRG